MSGYQAAALLDMLRARAPLQSWSAGVLRGARDSTLDWRGTEAARNGTRLAAAVVRAGSLEGTPLLAHEQLMAKLERVGCSGPVPFPPLC